MTAMTNAIAALEALSLSEMQALIPSFNSMMKAKRSIDASVKIGTAGGFKFGDIIQWASSKRGRPAFQYMKFTQLNRAGTCVVGMECDSEGKSVPPTPGKTGKWTVAIVFVTSVNGKPFTA